MLENCNKLNKKEVYTNKGNYVGKLFSEIIDPFTGKILGFIVSPQQNILLAEDILLWHKKQIIIKDKYELHPPEEIVRINNCLKSKICIKGSYVFTKSGNYLGKVTAIFINTNTYYLHQLIVKKSFLHFFKYDTKLIPHKSIIEIKPKHILVSDTFVYIKDLSEQKAHQSLSGIAACIKD